MYRSASLDFLVMMTGDWWWVAGGFGIARELCSQAVLTHQSPTTRHPSPLQSQRLPPGPTRRLLRLVILEAVDLHAAHPRQLDRIVGGANHFFPCDLARHVELIERIVHRLHSVLLSRLHHRVDLVDLVLTNQRADRGRADEN